MDINLSADEKQTMVSNGVLEAGPYVVLSTEAYRQLFGLETDKDLADSLKKIEVGIAQSQGAETQTVQEFFAEFEKRHGV